MDAIEGFRRNWIGLFQALPTYYKPARFWRDDGVVIGITGLRLEAFNGAVFEDDNLLTAGRLSDLETLFRGAGIAFSIQLFSREPLYPRHTWMIEQGYIELFTDPLMIFEGPLPAYPHAPALEVRELARDDLSEFAEYREIYATGFGLPHSLEDFYNTFANMHENRRIIARLNGKPVGSGLLMCFDHTAGVYNLTTLPDMRRRGIATAMMAALHKLALADGYSGTVLAASSMGLPLYQSLGYRLDGYQHVYIPEQSLHSLEDTPLD